MGILGDSTKLIDSIGSNVDKNFESGEERQQQLSARHQVDMASDSWLSKNIRPVTLIFLMVCEAMIILAMIIGKPVDEWVVGQVGTLLFGAFGFYFNSRKGEKMMAAKSKAATDIELIKAKATIKSDRRKDKQQRREDNRNKRNE